MAAAVMAHAEARYNDGGWDVIVECWTLGEIEASLAWSNPADTAEAIQHFAELADVLAERQADADYYSRNA